MMEPKGIESLAPSTAEYSLQQLRSSHASQPPQLRQSYSGPTQQSTPTRQYTTVGSVYNPQTQPLQPPIRRGRNSKPLFPYRSEPAIGPSQLQYTPLQQNSDRAISPARFDSNSVTSAATIARQEIQTLPSFPAFRNTHTSSNVPQSLASPTYGMANMAQYLGDQTANSIDAFTSDLAGRDNSSVYAKTDTTSDHESDSTDTKPISAMGFNSLTNLASYPNPMQRAAQKVLASHRPHPAPTTGPRVSCGQTNPNSADAELSMSPSDTTMYMPTVPHGAPAPLTAGPPGVRQFRPTTFDQDILQRVRDFDDEDPMINPYHARLHSTQHHTAPSCTSESSSSTLTEDDSQDANPYVVDTLSIEEAHQFYPRGLPLNFNINTVAVSRHWDLERLEGATPYPSTYAAQDEEFWAKRTRHIDDHFYSGLNRLNKSFDTAVSEHKHRCVTHLVGRPYREPSNKWSRVIKREITVRDASLLSTSEKYEFSFIHLFNYFPLFSARCFN
ncbi:putative pyrimidine-specific ribonucleoside hydrolase [Rosellinia necatrix]|uniref:Putative pyrimidine-specific ribonucleoside hydrolase n=1 Tax=Rosellinia necatrix TaxID=77044 RepID=A0A1W2TEW4_ROSNE|nr:putative pyrimidine-specific ribonucleoside hydrolase [Rosellinia necatrix]